MNEQGILRTDLIESAAAELDLDVEVRTRGKHSLSVDIYCGTGRDRWSDRSLSVTCRGNTYSIKVRNQDKSEVWAMPRDEVASDRADRFALEVINEFGGDEYASLSDAVARCLGIDSLPSHSHTRDRLRSSKSALPS